jgi:uncharacterized protein
MSDLHAAQSAFARVLDGATAADRLPFVGAASTVAARLEIYRSNVTANHRKALVNAYPIVERLVGAAFFDGLAREYARAHPSNDGDLNVFGAAFPAFLRGFPHVRSLPYLPDVARLEWAIHRAHYAANAPVLDARRLAAVPPERQGALHLRLHAACALLDSPWPLARIWEVHRDDYDGDPRVDFDEGPHRCLVHRPLWRVMVGKLEAGPDAFLRAVQAGEPLETCVGAALAADPAFDLGAALAAWIDARVIVDFSAGA